jgi:hypothetical protein
MPEMLAAETEGKSRKLINAALMMIALIPTMETQTRNWSGTSMGNPCTENSR